MDTGKLKRSTLLVIIGISYIFILKLVGTIFPGIFIGKLILVKLTNILSFLAVLVTVLFFYDFYCEYVKKEQGRLRNATILAIIGSVAVLFVHLKSLLFIFKLVISPYLFRSLHAEAVIPWVDSIFILIFFIVLYKCILRKEQVRLEKAALFAIIGSCLSIFIRTVVLFYYLSYGNVMWFSDLPRNLTIIFIPVYTLGFIATIYFFLTFYKELD